MVIAATELLIKGEGLGNWAQYLGFCYHVGDPDCF